MFNALTSRSIALNDLTNAVRAAADDLDVAPSIVRRTLGALLERMKEASLTSADIDLAAVEEKRRLKK